MTTSHMFNRRQFIKDTALATSGLIIAFTVPALAGKRRLLDQAPIAAPGKILAPNTFLRIGPDGTVTITLSHCEMGQGISTSLAMLIAEELDADWQKIKVEDAPAALAYYHTMYGTQRTGGSSSLLSEFDRYRNAGATARAMLVQAAAKRLQADVKDCKTENGYVIAGDKKLSYGELAEEAAALPVPREVTLKERTDWKFIGKPIKRLDTPVKVNGEAIFGMDIHFPGMLTALVARGPVPGAKVKTYNAKATLAIPGVRQVVVVPTGVAVLADNFWAAKKGREALKIDWELGQAVRINSATLLSEFRQRADEGGLVATNTGNPENVFPKAAHVVEAEYFQPFLAHAPMEPLNCTVQLTADKCEIWTGTQTVTDDQKAASDITGLPIDNVFIHNQFLGGSFGRRNITRSDFVREAVEVAKASGKLVKTVWTREDDIQGGMYRPAFLHRFKIGLDSAGAPIAWKQISVGQSVMTGGPFEKVAVINGVDQFSIEGMHTVEYVKSIPDQRIELNTPVWPISVDNWRAVGLSHTIFAMESLIDELAYAVKKDPVEYRRMLYRDAPRHLKVLEMLAEKSNWGQPLPAGHGRGIAVFEAVGSYAGVVAEVAVMKDMPLKVHKVTCVIDCGTVVNPDGVIAQMDSNILYGLSTTMYSEITFKAGRVQQSGFLDYKVLRMNETPGIETFIMPSNEKPGGIGEAAVGQIMPAITNAIFAATGKRIRSLPLAKHDLHAEQHAPEVRLEKTGV
ncbi:xanthine dehydrogenase family protein molybdopterin-binding subunit [Chitinophaga filiformis]|uniref:Isoquinoline 1-oxidoreductase, beta subunit n=1 Tax=Chitinophaga filiformis TaxID=104663 RepID=A0A1G7ZGF0_CHIFI|nr:xanthine dehydrogenase family protein molybdopterin-binding subunit [Chitinophaga filiformis]SDH07616.1 isoquinoline 1-oxidoreductase, beta subunit [Chitinophaga filiformis]